MYLLFFPQGETVFPNSKQVTSFITNLITAALKINNLIIQGNKIYSWILKHKELRK